MIPSSSTDLGRFALRYCNYCYRTSEIMRSRIQNKIMEYRELVAEQERELAQLEAECSELRNELAGFEARFNKLIQPLMDQLDAAKAAVRSLQELQTKKLFEGVSDTVESLWQSGPRIEVNPEPDEHTEAWDTDIDDRSSTSRRKVVNSKEHRLKQLYRQLARRFHPDYAQNDEDRTNRTRLMVLINRAYQESDLDSLQLLDGVGDGTQTVASPVDSLVSLETLELQHLQKRHHDLTMQIRDIKLARSDLRYGSMMEMKMEESMARARGEDMLANLAQELTDEYWAYVRQLDELQASLE